MKKYIKISCCSVILGCLIYMGYSIQESSPEVYAEETANVYNVVEKEYSGTSNQLASSNGKTLLLDADNLILSLRDDTTGISVSTRYVDGSNHTQKSDFIVSYYSHPNIVYTGYANITSSEWCIDTGNYSYYEVENGVGVKYTIANTAISITDFPQKMSVERMESLLANLSDSEKMVLEGAYDLIKGVYTSNYHTKVFASLKAEQYYTIFYISGGYTEEDLLADNEEFEIEVTSSSQEIIMYVEYFLENGDLVVRIPTQYITSLETRPYKGINVLPYFMTSGEETEGYMFIPDGSGALIYLDSDKLSETAYSAPFYNGDTLIQGISYSSQIPTLNMPVFGMKVGDYAIMGIIEEGAEIATLSANINGYAGSEAFSKIGVNFDLLPQQTIEAATLSSFSVNSVQDEPYTKDIVVRYSLLTGDEADYVGMASKYQSYLLEADGMVAKPVEDEASLYVELLGSVEKLNYFMGVPFRASNALTTFDQAEEMLTSFQSSGIENMKVEYAGIANGGLSAGKLTKVSIESVLGGSSGLKDLMSYASASNIEIFPKFSFQSVDDKSDLKTEEHAYYMSGQVAEILDYDSVLLEIDTSTLHNTYLIRGSYLPTYVEAFHKSFASTGISTLSAPDIFNDYIGNYKKGKMELPSNTIPSYHEATNFLSENYTLMLSNPIDSAYQYADYLTDIPMQTSDIRVLDTYVPFMQLVFNGVIDYSTPVLNQDNSELTEVFMNAIESRSSLKFRLTYEDASVLRNTDFDKIFLTHYEQWEEEIATLYGEYNYFYQLVKDSTIESHEIINRNDELRVVKYENGVTVYLNYSDTKAVLQGVSVEPSSYVITN